LAGTLSVAGTSVAAVPAAAQSEAPGTTPSGSATATAAPTATVARAVPRIGVRIKRLHVRAGGRVAVLGRVRGVGRVTVTLQIRTRSGWKTIDRARTRSGGRYALAKRLKAPISERARVLVRPTTGVRSTSRRLGRVNVYRVAYASWYGPGLYGNHLGCGGRLGAGQLGVAHKSLPCGTKVTFRHNGRSVRVPVIDRGPYVGGREYDLTAATAQAIGFHGHGPVLATR
jgi:hypothetical protein